MKYTSFAVIFLATLFKTLDVFASSISAPLQQLLDNATSDANSDPASPYRYPTDLTRGIVPKRLHSHNDYWRDVPFYSALAAGCISIEADVWLYNSMLFVGHEPSALSTSRTLSSLYIDPLLKSLRMMNPSTAFVFRESGTRPNGLYDTDSGQTTYLHIDIKTTGDAALPHIFTALEPLRAAGFLTISDTAGPVTVVLTGNVPVKAVLAQPQDERTVFMDVALDGVMLDMDAIDGDIAPFASADLMSILGTAGRDAPLSEEETTRQLEARNGTFTSEQSKAIEGLIEKAGKKVGKGGKGIGVRFWNTPQWPVAVRRRVQDQLWSAGVGLLSIDDLEAAVEEVGSWDGG